jgi:microcystin-dependent protein
MSELKVDTISPALATKIVITPGVVVQDSVGTEQFEVTSSGEIKVLGPLRVGSIVNNTPGTSQQVLTSQGSGLPPVWTEGFPFGGIIMWYGLASSIPAGWALCDGRVVFGYTTPNLLNKFIVGAGDSYTVNQNGGSPDAVVGAHSHTITDPGHGHFFVTDDNLGGLSPTNIGGKPGLSRLSRLSGGGSQGGGDLWLYSTSNTDKTNVTIASAGESGTGKNLPPYYALCYIMRVPTS